MPDRINEWLRDPVARASSTPWTTLVIALVAIGVVVLHIVQVLDFVVPAGQFKNLHLGTALFLSFLMFAESARGAAARHSFLAWWVLALASLVPLAYIHIEYPALVGARAFLPSDWDLVIATLLLVLALVSTARQWGLVIPVIAVVSLLYGMFGYLLPGEVLHHAGMRLQRLIGYTSIPYFRGLLGGLIELSANMIFIFMIFAGLLKAMGGLDLVMRLSFGLTARSRSGPAQAAVVGSGFMGMISGSIMANVASTGAFTIPLMRRLGFSPSYSGAVEAVASTGGQITPPTMGLAAFLIVGITGIAYVDIMAAAVFPALIYFGYLLASVHIYAVRRGIQPASIDLSDEGLPLADVSAGRALLLYGHLLVGLVTLVWLLVLQMPAGVAAAYSIFVLIALEMAKQLLMNWRRPLRGLAECLQVTLRGFVEGARGAAQMAVVIAVLGILVEVFVATGFAQKLSYLMLDVARHNFWLLLVVAGGACLAFGIGMPTPAAYILVALLGAPALVEFGVPVLAAHLYLFYLANMSALTPPVATGALVAAQLAGAGFFSTSFVALRLALPGFILPFAFVLHPEILGLDTSLWTQMLTSGLALVALVALNAAFEGAFLRMLGWHERVLLVAGVALVAFAAAWSAILGGLLLAVVVALQIRGAGRDVVAISQQASR